jgi:3-deoxy-D-manno-octulosonic-acid transferase|tara:strand:+ start:630 stop:1913 length:1284 start_codon:yes stop_codon:yes gene_type:complete
MIFTYRVLTNLLYPLLIIFIFFRKILKKEDTIRYKEKILISHFKVDRKKNTRLIWFHAASIGEFKSILPIVEELNIKNKNLEFLITTVTLSSSNLAEVELKRFNNVRHRFIPLDVNFLISEFMRLWKPNIIFLVDSEIWPNLISKANQSRIPIGIINARITAHTFKKWMLFPKTAKKIFSLIDLFLTSNVETKNFLFKLNAKNIFFNGNIKLITKVNKNDAANINEKILIRKNTWIAASTHNGEEFLCLQTHLRLKKKLKNLLTIIAPRHIGRVNSINKIFKKFKLNTQILNKNEIIEENKEIIIINSFGVLQDYFKHAKSVFMGKSTIKKIQNSGGQNPIDAAKLGCKIYHGKYVSNFKDIYEILKENNVSKIIENSLDLSENLIGDFENPIKENVKITKKINDLGQKTLTETMKVINNFLFNEIK